MVAIKDGGFVPQAASDLAKTCPPEMKSSLAFPSSCHFPPFPPFSLFFAVQVNVFLANSEGQEGKKKQIKVSRCDLCKKAISDSMSLFAAETSGGRALWEISN